MLTQIAWRGEDASGEEGNMQTWQVMYVKCVCKPESFFPQLMLKHILLCSVMIQSYTLESLCCPLIYVQIHLSC